jgi:TRAP-type C4-dicarboxylate transport system permease small subunit
VGVVFIVAAFDIPSALAERLPARTLPLAMGCATMVTSLLLALRSWRSSPSEPIPIDWPKPEGWCRVGVTFLSVFGYVALIAPIGMPLATLAFCAFLIWYLERRIVRAVLVGAVTAAIVLYGFIHALEVTFPVGPFNW